jgi:hypothetical protein
MAKKWNLTDERTKKMAEDAEKGFTLLPEGKHLMRCLDVEYKVAGDPPKDSWRLTLAVVPGEPHEHTNCFDSLFFTEKAIGRVLLCLRAFGVPDEQLAGIDPEDLNAQKALIGRTAIVDVEQSVGKDGKTYANPTYAGYHSAVPGKVQEMRQERAAAGTDGGKADARPIAGVNDPTGDLPF